jgi:TonB-dependent SusC/RagA subfamily outer membrane receptor
MKTLAIVSVVVMLACSRNKESAEGPAPRAAPPPPAPNEVTADEDARAGAQSLDQMLAGRISGVTVYSVPGGGIIVRFAGPTSFYAGQEPLFVIDGVPTEVQRGALSWLSPNDVQSIRALKGADATIYGVRGSNGVIEIKTKGSH